MQINIPIRHQLGEAPYDFFVVDTEDYSPEELSRMKGGLILPDESPNKS